MKARGLIFTGLFCFYSREPQYGQGVPRSRTMNPPLFMLLIYLWQFGHAIIPACPECDAVMTATPSLHAEKRLSTASISPEPDLPKYPCANRRAMAGTAYEFPLHPAFGTMQWSAFSLSALEHVTANPYSPGYGRFLSFDHGAHTIPNFLLIATLNSSTSSFHDMETDRMSHFGRMPTAPTRPSYPVIGL